MTATPPPAVVASFYDTAPSPQRETMLTMRERILTIVPGVEEVVKYNMPTFQLDGVDVCGLLPHTKHVGYYPYSGSVLAGFPDLVAKYGGTKGSLHVPIDAPLPKTVLSKLIKARLAQGR